MGALGAGDGHGLLDVDRAHDVVRGALHDRELREAGGGGELDDLGDRVGGVDARHLHARGHDLRRGARPEGHRALDEVGGLVVQRPLEGAASGQGGQLVGAPRRAQLLLRLDAQRAHQGVGRAVEQPDGPGHHAGERADEALGAARDRQRQGDGQLLGHQLAEDHRGHGREDQAEGDRDAGHGGRGDPGGPQRTAEQRGDGGLGEEADDQVGQGDPDLGARELGRQRAQGRAHALRLLVARVGGPVHGRPVHGDEGVLGRPKTPQASTRPTETRSRSHSTDPSSGPDGGRVEPGTARPVSWEARGGAPRGVRRARAASVVTPHRAHSDPQRSGHARG